MRTPLFSSDSCKAEGSNTSPRGQHSTRGQASQQATSLENLLDQLLQHEETWL
jgi:hypothetical protein